MDDRGWMNKLVDACHIQAWEECITIHRYNTRRNQRRNIWERSLGMKGQITFKWKVAQQPFVPNRIFFFGLSSESHHQISLAGGSESKPLCKPDKSRTESAKLRRQDELGRCRYLRRHYWNNDVTEAQNKKNWEKKTICRFVCWFLQNHVICINIALGHS